MSPLPRLLSAAIKSLAPRRYILWRGPRRAPGVALTFDDGPHPEHTPRVLDALAAAQARATFFLLGEKALQHEEIVRRIRERGHQIAIHGWTHEPLARLEPKVLARELDRAEQALRPWTQPPIFFRPVRGILSLALLRETRRRGWIVAMWNQDPRDYAQSEPEPILRIAAAARPGDIILLHDRLSLTADVLPELLDRLGRQGLRPATLDQMLDR
jgi:peptidoglycan/xylan/chitin deacetylase (PgdA/CDA1 family)